MKATQLGNKHGMYHFLLSAPRLKGMRGWILAQDRSLTES